VAAQVLQAGKALVAGLARVRPLACVAAQVALQVRLPLHRVRAEGTLEAHGGVGIWRRSSRSGYRAGSDAILN